jgi:hypothetical protein
MGDDGDGGTEHGLVPATTDTAKMDAENMASTEMVADVSPDPLGKVNEVLLYFEPGNLRPCLLIHTIHSILLPYEILIAQFCCVQLFLRQP